jgi:hypothetical protein
MVNTLSIGADAAISIGTVMDVDTTQSDTSKQMGSKHNTSQVLKQVLKQGTNKRECAALLMT